MGAVESPPQGRNLSLEEANKLLSVASTSVGNEFFAAMAKALSELLGVRWVLVSKVHRENSTRAYAEVVWDDGIREPFDYDLPGSPCENILTQSACAYPEDLQNLFPADQLLADMGAHAYVGVPVCSSAGKVLGLLAVLHDKPLEDTQMAMDAIGLFAGRTGAELERIATASDNERLGRIVEESLSEAFIFSADTFKFELVNKGARRNLGYSIEELRSLTPWDIKPEYSELQFKDFVAPLLKGETSQLQFETVHLRKDGSTYNVSVQLQYFPKPDHVFFASISDTTAQREAAERESLLVREVNHRSKNLLALVQIIARQTASRHPQDYVDALEHRIKALAANQDVLVHNHWTDIPFRDLLRSQLAHFEGFFGDRIILEGPDLFIKSTPAQAFGMAIHELATNAAKYGALSNDTGKVEISWSLSDEQDAQQRVLFEWREHDGPSVEKPQGNGFGTVIIERQMKGLLEAQVEVDFSPAGLCYRVDAPAERVVDRAHG